MYCVRKVTNDLYWVGANDHRLALFENCFPIPRGVSYNSYCLLDEKTVLFDTVDWSACRQLLENLAYVLDGRELDYLLVNHLEPDHAACIEEILLRHPKVKLISNEKAFMLMRQFGFHVDGHECIEVKEGDTFSFGKHTVTFVGAPMVHWPEAMVTLDVTDGVLFSADAFGSFGALNGHLFDDEIDFGFSNTETLSKKWSAAGSDPIADLQKWKRAISKDGYVNANICIMSVDAANAFIGNANVQKLLDIRNYEIATIKPRELSNGVSFIGNIPMMGLSIYTYDEWYLDDWTEPGSPVTKPYVPDGTVGLFSTAARFDMLYGAISNFNGKTQAHQTFTGKRYSESFLSSDNRVRTVRISSRPLAVPHNLKSWYIAKVL